MTFPVLEEKISCPASGPIPAINGSIKAAVLTKTHAVVQIGVAASGTIIPPKLDEFGLFAGTANRNIKVPLNVFMSSQIGLDATLGGTLDLSASASVRFRNFLNTLDGSQLYRAPLTPGKLPCIKSVFPASASQGELTIVQIKSYIFLPTLTSSVRILEIGPTFKVLGETKVTLDVDVDMKVGFSYTVSNAKLFFPSSYSQKSGGDFTPGDTRASNVSSTIP